MGETTFDPNLLDPVPERIQCAGGWRRPGSLHHVAGVRVDLPKHSKIVAGATSEVCPHGLDRFGVRRQWVVVCHVVIENLLSAKSLVPDGGFGRADVEFVSENG